VLCSAQVHADCHQHERRQQAALRASTEFFQLCLGKHLKYRSAPVGPAWSPSVPFGVDFAKATCFNFAAAPSAEDLASASIVVRAWRQKALCLWAPAAATSQAHGHAGQGQGGHAEPVLRAGAAGGRAGRPGAGLRGGGPCRCSWLPSTPTAGSRGSPTPPRSAPSIMEECRHVGQQGSTVDGACGSRFLPSMWTPKKKKRGKKESQNQ